MHPSDNVTPCLAPCDVQHKVLKDKCAEYGEEVVKVLAKDLTVKYGEGFTWRNLYNYIDFYSTYNGFFSMLNGESANVQTILHALSAKSEIKLIGRIILQEYPKKLVRRKLNVNVQPSKIIVGGVYSISVSKEVLLD